MLDGGIIFLVGMQARPKWGRQAFGSMHIQEKADHFYFLRLQPYAAAHDLILHTHELSCVDP